MSRRTVARPQAGLGYWVMALAVALIALAVMASGVRAQDALDKGLKTGATVPAGMKAPDQTGEIRSLKTLSGRAGLILLFTRSLDW